MTRTRSRRTVHGIDLTAPDGVTRLLAYHRGRWGTATMTAPGGEGGGQGGEGGTGGAGGQGEGGQPGGESTTGGQSGEQPRFTQADLDRVLQQRLADEQSKWQKKLDDAQALAGKNETEKLQTQLEQANSRATETQQKAAQRIAQTEAKVAAIAAGANPDRLAAIVRNADLDSAVKDGDVDEAAVKAAIDKVLADYPEWKKTPATSSASGGELNGGGGNGKPSFTRKQIEDMSSEERTRRIDEINEALADGRVTG